MSLANDNSDIIPLGERYIVHSRSRWQTIDGDGQACIIKDRATGRAFTILADPETQNKVCEALNIADQALDRTGESDLCK